jgi:DNA-binding NtrC family response regulator
METNGLVQAALGQRRSDLPAKRVSEVLTMGDVLVIDDHAAICDLIAEALTEDGYTVRCAYNGTEGLLAIADVPPAVVLLDLVMPGPPPTELIPQIWAIAPSMPITLMTAMPNEATALVAQYQIACIEKPFDIDALLGCVARYAQPKRASD